MTNGNSRNRNRRKIKPDSSGLNFLASSEVPLSRAFLAMSCPFLFPGEHPFPIVPFSSSETLNTHSHFFIHSLHAYPPFLSLIHRPHFSVSDLFNYISSLLCPRQTLQPPPPSHRDAPPERNRWSRKLTKLVRKALTLAAFFLFSLSHLLFFSLPLGCCPSCSGACPK